jgi:cbb3-type cytochrome oxidase maturation protein
MYFPYFIAYMSFGFFVSLVVFFWALNRGQFRDQRRARFLALEATPTAGTPAKLSRKGRIETWGLFALACLGLSASVAVIIFALTHTR